MTTVKKLLEAVSAPRASSGKVVASTETTLSVATRAGVIVVPRERTTLYTVGDEVRVANGMISGKVKDTASLPVYYV